MQILHQNLLKLLFFIVVIAASSCSSPKKLVDRSVPRHDQTRTQIVITAENYIGVPYVYGGKKPKGFDCSGFTTFVFNKNKIPLSGTSRHQSTLGKEKAPKYAKSGDLVFFLTRGEVRHVGIVSKRDKSGIWVIHSTSSRGVIEENISKSSYWSKKKFFIKDILS